MGNTKLNNLIKLAFSRYNKVRATLKKINKSKHKIYFYFFLKDNIPKSFLIKEIYHWYNETEKILEWEKIKIAKKKLKSLIKKTDLLPTEYILLEKAYNVIDEIYLIISNTSWIKEIPISQYYITNPIIKGIMTSIAIILLIFFSSYLIHLLYYNPTLSNFFNLLEYFINKKVY